MVHERRSPPMMNGTTGCPSLKGQVTRPRRIESDVDIDTVEAADVHRLRFSRDEPGVRRQPVRPRLDRLADVRCRCLLAFERRSSVTVDPEIALVSVEVEQEVAGEVFAVDPAVGDGVGDRRLERRRRVRSSVDRIEAGAPVEERAEVPRAGDPVAMDSSTARSLTSSADRGPSYSLIPATAPLEYSTFVSESSWKNNKVSFASTRARSLS